VKETHWYVVDGAHHYLTIGAIHSRHIDFNFVNDPERKVAERFPDYRAASDFLTWVCKSGVGVWPYRVIDYIDPVDPGPLHHERGPSRDELIRAALASDYDRYLIRARQEFSVVSK
jgi:hypothetical protein